MVAQGIELVDILGNTTSGSCAENYQRHIPLNRPGGTHSTLHPLIRTLFRQRTLQHRIKPAPFRVHCQAFKSPVDRASLDQRIGAESGEIQALRIPWKHIRGRRERAHECSIRQELVNRRVVFVRYVKVPIRCNDKTFRIKTAADVPGICLVRRAPNIVEGLGSTGKPIFVILRPTF